MPIFRALKNGVGIDQSSVLVVWSRKYSDVAKYFTGVSNNTSNVSSCAVAFYVINFLDTKLTLNLA